MYVGMHCTCLDHPHRMCICVCMSSKPHTHTTTAAQKRVCLRYSRRKHELMRACAREHITHIIFVLFYCAHALTSYRRRRRRQSKRRRLRFGGDRGRAPLVCTTHCVCANVCCSIVCCCCCEVVLPWSADLVGS